MSDTTLTQQNPTYRRLVGISWADVGIYPLIAALPFMYLPRVIDGDTQPWIFCTAFLAFFTFRAKNFLQQRDLLLIGLSIACIAAYALRSSDAFLIFRCSYMHIAFIMLWLVCRREKGELFGAAIRYTIIVWFIVGLYQFTSVAMGLGLGMPELFTGRYGTAGAGIPGLTAEPSFYGSLSAIHLMYLLSEKKKSNNIYIALASANVLLSGSLLAILLLGFPLMKLNFRLKLAAAILLPIFFVINFMLSAAGGLLSRVSFLQAADAVGSSSGTLFEKLLLDPSLSIRIGNVYFTLYENLWNSLSLTTKVDYVNDYSRFVQDTGIWYDPLTEYTIPSAGELIYGSGIFGALLMIAIIAYARKQAVLTRDKWEKIIFIMACFLNPITIANPFLIIYALKKPATACEDDPPRMRSQTR
jgi:hypothetical protein